jgi:hypothetical protein
MKKLISGILISSVIFSANLLHAQEAPDSIVQLTAQSEGLSLVAAADLPEEGTFWLVLTNGIVPDPAPLFDLSLPVYQIASGQYLVDATDGQVDTEGEQTVAEAVAALAGEVTNLINQIQNPPVSQTATRGRMMTMDDEGGLMPMDEGLSIDTNGLYLQIIGVTNGEASLALNNAADEVYAIWSTTNLALPITNWEVEAELWPTNGTTNTLPFTVDAGDNANLFLRAQDWTGVETNGLPAWWEWYWLGSLNYSADDLDSQGNTLLDDYENGIDPNPIQFSLQFTNDYFNTNPAYGTIAVSSGTPFYEAILINDTNLADAVWQPYTSTNMAVTFDTNGIYNVYVGLRGLPTNALQTWMGAQLTYDTVPPVLAVTNPTDGTVSVPTIQLQGYANETLSSLTFDVSNAAGVFTNQTGCLTGQFYDTNLLQFTTNYFQCYDVALTNGVNQITLHATDLAGNETTTNFNYTVDYSGVTNPPALTLIWPQNNALVSRSSFTIQAQVDDATATVTATITDTNGDTNIVPALVERNGAVWVENLPLNGGTNRVMLTATNAAGLGSATNFDVVQSAVSVTMDPLPDNELNQALVTVTGTVSDGSYDVWVNGVQATVSGDPTWEADNVPVNPTGTASFTVEAGLNLDNPLAGQTLVLEQPSVVSVISQHSNYQDVHTVHNFCDGADFISTYTEILDWTINVGGESSWYTTNFFLEEGNGLETNLSAANPPSPPWLYATTQQPYYQYVPNGESDTCDGPQSDSDITTQRAKTIIELTAEGPSQSGVMDLVRLMVQVNSGDAPFPVSAARILGQAPIPTETNDEIGELYVSVPAGATENITPVVPGADNYSFNVQATNVQFHIFDANSGQDLTTQTNTVIVGQQMNLYCQLSLTNETLTNFQWTVQGYVLTNWYFSSDFYNTNGYPLRLTETNNQTMQFFWTDGATNIANASNIVVACSATVGGKKISAHAVFKVLKPIVKINAQTSQVTLGSRVGDGLFSLCFGTNTTPGILFETTMQLPTGTYNYGDTQYSLEWWQIINGYQSGLYLQDGTNIVPVITDVTNILMLDTSLPYGFDSNFPWPDTDDSPSVGAYLDGEMGASFSLNATMWLMFKPDGGNWVPVRSVPWNCSGSATNSGSGWTLTRASWSTNPPDLDAGTDYPTWTNNTHAYGLGN